MRGYILLSSAWLLAESAAALTATTSRSTFKGLDTSSFRHPLDNDLTSFVRDAPLNGVAESAIRTSLAVVEQGVRLDLLSSSVRVSPEQLPELYDSLLEACDVLDMDTDRPPELYVQSSPQANAYTLALRNEKSAPLVVVTSALLDRCTEREVQAIIGHELGHLKCEHSIYLTLGGLASTALRGVPFAGARARSLLERWQLAAEYSCDRAAMLVAQDSSVVAGAMLKLFGGTSRSLSAEAFIQQCAEYDEALKTANPFVRASINMQQRTHPLPVKRVSELENWAKSEDYLSIVESGTPLEVSAV
mmetsp:Transcript_35729/g.106622  ORF Transcript_35729/g.106622 Transcript_35729/m.106622 type:complete len:304 (-) Transcript_35729:155-1066(-)